jgi:hypothetical protein
MSPAYDLNPVPVQFRPRILSTLIDEQSGDASIELALSVAIIFASRKPRRGKQLMMWPKPCRDADRKQSLWESPRPKLIWWLQHLTTRIWRRPEISESRLADSGPFQ